MAKISNKDDVVLGSGDLYLMEYADTVPTDTEIEIEANQVGHIQGGAALEYTNEWKTVKDDMGVIVKNFLTNENVVFNSGMLSWNGKQLAMLCSTSRVTEPTAGDPVRTVKFGGLKNGNGKQYVVHFVHKKDNGKKIRITIVGNSTNGFTLTFDPENETVIDAQFTAVASDAEGTLVIYKEEVEVPTP